jgi:hypothetical protein
MRLISRENTGQIFFQAFHSLKLAIYLGNMPLFCLLIKEFHDFVKSIFMLVGRSEQNARKIRSGSLLLGGTTLIMDSAGGRRTPTVKSAAILASAITTPCAAPTLALSGAMPMKKAIYCRAYTVFRVKLHIFY